MNFRLLFTLDAVLVHDLRIEAVFLLFGLPQWPVKVLLLFLLLLLRPLVTLCVHRGRLGIAFSLDLNFA